MSDTPATTTNGTAPAFEPVGEPFTDASGAKWQGGVKLIEAPKPPPAPKVTITAPGVALLDRSTPTATWTTHLWRWIALALFLLGGGVYVIDRADWPGGKNDPVAAAEARINALAAEANAKLAAQHQQIEALRAQLAAAQQAPPASGAGNASPAPPPEVVSGQFEVYVDHAKRRIVLGKLATDVHRVEARALVAQREAFHGEADWRIVDPWAGIAPPAAAPPQPSGPPPGHVQITESEYRALQACRAVLVRWQSQRTWLRLNDDERAEASAAVGR